MTDCMYPEFLGNKKPGECSPEQKRRCHEKSGGVHPLPDEDAQKKEQDKK